MQTTMQTENKNIGPDLKTFFSWELQFKSLLAAADCSPLTRNHPQGMRENKPRYVTDQQNIQYSPYETLEAFSNK